MARAKQTYKKEKYQELIQNEINRLFRTKFSDPGLKFATITKVELSRDFIQAKVYWDTYSVDRKEEVGKAIGRVSGAVRSSLARILDCRVVPELSFAYDSQFECENEIDALLKKEEKLGKYSREDGQKK